MKFLADDMLGRLAKWLRILGYDTVHLSKVSDDEILRYARANGRILLTRDRVMVKRAFDIPSLLILSTDYKEQLKQVMTKYGLEVWENVLFSMCVECNVPVKSVAKDSLINLVPPTALETHEEFWQCPQCLKVFWRGSHFENTVRKLKAFV